jgi:hypothetical protein
MPCASEWTARFVSAFGKSLAAAGTPAALDNIVTAASIAAEL